MASELHVDAIKHSGGTSALTIDSSGNLTASANVHYSGAIIQVVQGTTTSASSFSIGTGSFSSTLMSATITPKFNTSKILITGVLNGSSDSQSHGFFIALQRGSTDIGQGDANGSRTRVHSGFAQMLQNSDGNNGGGNGAEILGHGSINFLDSPSTTSSTTYNVKVSHNSGGTQTFLLNRTKNDGNNSAAPRCSSTLTLMEIAQ
tara:strand:- start:356 stop:967 length:612 start_codon:yes stop_codon:yes gene_type:complete